MTTRSPALALLLGAALAAGGAACRRDAKDPDAGTVATVNGEAISRTDFERELARELVSDEAPERTPEQVEPFKRALLETLLERALLLQAARNANVAASPEEVDREMMKLTSDYPAGNFNEALAQGQLSLAELKTRTAALLTIEKLFETVVYARVAVTEEELRAYWAQHEGDFAEPEQVRASQIVVREEEDARRVLAQLRAGKKFADLARRYSLSADAKVGGDLGFFERGVMPPQFDEVAFRLGVGQVSEVVSTDYGFHVFKVTERRPGRQKSFAEARREVERRLLADKRRQAQEAYVKDLRAKAQLWVNEPVLQAIRGVKADPKAVQAKE